MGGGIAQYLAVHHGNRVATPTLMSTSPAVRVARTMICLRWRIGSGRRSPTPAAEPDWTDCDAVIAHLVEGERRFAGLDSFDEASVHKVARRVVERTVNLGSSTRNHWLLEGGEDTRLRLGEVRAPTLGYPRHREPAVPARARGRLGA